MEYDPKTKEYYQPNGIPIYMTFWEKLWERIKDTLNSIK